MNRKSRQLMWAATFALALFQSHAIIGYLSADEPRIVIKGSSPSGEVDGSVSVSGALQLNNNADLRRLLLQGRAKVEAGKFAEGLTSLQRILDRGDDGFVRLQARGELVSIRLETLATFSAMPPEGLATAEKLFGTQARQLFEQARLSGRSVKMAEVVRRFFHTQAGFDAARWQATRLLDQSEPVAAARLFDRVLNEPAHRQRIDSSLRVQAAAAQRLAGNESRVTELLAQIGNDGVTFRGEPRTADQLAEVLPHMASRLNVQASRDWIGPTGGSTRNVMRPGSVPWLSPRWNLPLFGHPDHAEPLARWIEQQQFKNPPQLNLVHEPLVVGGVVVVRSSGNVHALDLQTGRCLWRFRSSISLPDLIQITASGLGGQVFAVEDMFVGNSARGTLSSDGRRVFVIDEVLPKDDARLAKPGNKPNDAPDEFVAHERPRVLTRLVALPLEPAAASARDVSDVQPAWILEGSTLGAKLAGAGHCIQFLGPPTVFDGQLFAIGELFSLQDFDTQKVGQLSLLVIDPVNGELLWSQGLALVGQPFFRSEERARRNPIGSPSAAEGMLVCPTEVGLVLGVDLVSSRQRWVYDTRATIEDRRALLKESQGWQGSPVWPVIHRGCVLLLPRDSDDLHCLELATGRLLWRVNRGQAIYIGAVTDDVIVLIGDREAKAIPFSRVGPTVGSEVTPVWTQLLGQVTGRGVRVSDSYLVPLKSGRIASLDIATGVDRGFAFRRTTDAVEPKSDIMSNGQRTAAWPGNLVASGDMILSMGPTRLVAYSQAHAVMASLPQPPESVEHRLLHAEMSMLLGSKESSVADLQKVLKQPLSVALRQQAEQQLRESLFLELGREPQRADEYLQVLSTLATTVPERVRLLRHECEFWLQSDPIRSVRAAQELAALTLDQDIDLNERGQHSVSLRTWSRGIIRQARRQTEQRPEQADQILDLLNQERDQLLTANDLASLRRFAHLCGDWPQANEVRLRLSDLLIDRGDWQEAELLLLRARQDSDERIVADSTARLLRLWNAAGLHAQAANLLAELDGRLANIPITGREQQAPSITGKTFVAAFPRDSLTWLAYARRQKPNWDVRRVVISEDRSLAGSSRLAESFDQTNKFFRTPTGCSVSLSEKRPLFQSSTDTAWHVVDKDSGAFLGQVLNMEKVWYPSSQSSWSAAHSGHLLPLGGPGQLRAVSLLERDGSDCSWERPFSSQISTEEYPRVGPSGADFLTFQSRQQLIVVDPTNGRTLWSRSQLDPHSGMFAENEWGLFGDSEVLVLFNQDSTSFTVYETATGRELRRGKLNIDLHQNRRTFGRRMFYFTNGADPDNPSATNTNRNERRIRIWDPLNNRFDLDEPYTGRITWNTTTDGELLLVQTSGRIRVINVPARQVNLDVTLPTTATVSVNAVRAFSDHERYFVNIQRGLADSSSGVLNYYANDVHLPRADIQGELYAFSRPSQPGSLDGKESPLGRQLWLRLLPQRTFLRLDQARLPFLIALAKQQDQKVNSRVSLRIDAIDANTGIVLGSHDHLPQGRLVQLQFEIEQGRIKLLGLQTAVRIQFDRQRQGIATIDDPL